MTAPITGIGAQASSALSNLRNSALQEDLAARNLYKQNASELKNALGNPSLKKSNPLDAAQKAACDANQANSATSFPGGNLLANGIDAIDKTQKVADALTKEVFAGKYDNLHQCMIAREEANLAFEVGLSVKNAVIESWRELNRMSV